MSSFCFSLKFGISWHLLFFLSWVCVSSSPFPHLLQKSKSLIQLNFPALLLFGKISFLGEFLLTCSKNFTRLKKKSILQTYKWNHAFKILKIQRQCWKMNVRDFKMGLKQGKNILNNHKKPQTHFCFQIFFLPRFVSRFDC